MPRLALVLVAIWFLLLFVFRTALQWWRTGSGGLRGLSGAPGSLAWNAGLLTSLGMLSTLLAPWATLASWPGGALWLSHDALHGFGAALVTLGMLGALAAQMSMGDSWRIGVDTAERTRFVSDGLFSVVRNPIFSFMLLSGAGLLLLLPSLFSLLAFAFTLAGIELHVRVVEEPHLERSHGAAYRAYAARVGRFLPGLGLWREPEQRPASSNGDADGRHVAG